MPSRIVSSDRSAGEACEWWIEKPFLTIGGGEGSDIRVPVPGLDDGGVCIQYGEGVYEVFNKSSPGLRVGGMPLAAGQRSVWSPSMTLEWDCGVALRLSVEADPAPSPRPVGGVSIAAKPKPKAESPSNTASAADPVADQPAGPGLATRVMQFSVIGACVLALVAMVRSSGDAGPVAGTATVDFNDVIQLLARSPAAPSQRPGVVAPDPVRLARRMRAAEAAFRRQDKTRARDHYARLRRYIAGTGSDDEVDRQLLLLVEERLAAIANMPGS